MTEKYDVLIVGAGMVGAAAACALAQRGLSVGLVEAQTPASFEADQPMDLRVSAISAASEQLLAELGAWPGVLARRAAPYDTLATWEWQRSEVDFKAEELGHSHLGHIVENRVVQLALWDGVAQHPSISLMTGQAPSKFWQDEQGAYLLLGDRTLQGQIMLGCDGAQSRVRQAAGIGVTGWQYRHHCLAINVRTELPQQRITWQEFTPAGPRAFLPLVGQHASLVWYDSPERVAQLKAMRPAELAAEIQHHFPDRLGAFEIERCASFPLTRQHAQQYVQQRMVLLGDAAHTINPLAGQGVNLGFKDVRALAEVIGEALDQQQDWWSPTVLQRYQRRRRPDNLMMQSAMDLFYNLFSNQRRPLALVRNLGLMAAQRSGPIKNQVMRYAMGL
ncbi:FAD-dependent oxidoreductase [Ferrimonas marina]|uniref:2-octaprenyl-3-methyl-6-methoxy-1,4-benzoquinol hydroxylase n=1 Tax=Ferrimonas marina TaxID=299255 RepID=A0A1M5V8R5_9GAMM|nr:FAD-dependent oxidoreductase [Ferrimonas marina]SHH71591.1 2-octaprenyl-3-methyl-6-methoxy-1,4-benzoquinol hydroxylase [Ferrimonas marina]